MKKKTLKLFACVLGLSAIVAGIGAATGTSLILHHNEPIMANAADVVYKTALFGASYNSKGVSSYTDSFTSTNDGFTVSVANGNNNNNGWDVVKFGRKGSASTGSVSTSAAVDSAVTKISLTIDSITASSVNSIKLYTSSNGSSWSESGSFTKAKGTQTVQLSTPTKNLFYKVELSCASGSSNGFVAVSKIEYFYDPASTVVPTSVDLLGEETITGGVKGSVTSELLYEVSYETGKEGKQAVTFASSDETLAVIDSFKDGVAIIRFLDNAPDGVTITCTAAEDENVKASHKFVVTGLTDPETILFTKLTEEPADWTGSYLLAYEDGEVVFDGSISSGLDASGNNQEVTIQDSAITLYNRDFSFEITKKNNDKFSLKTNSGLYIGQTANDNGLKSSATDIYENTISFNQDGTINVISSGAYLRFNATAGQERFRYFKSSSYASQKAINLYRAGTDDEIVVRKFVDGNLKFDVVDIDNKGTGLCKTDGWYDDAKKAYDKLSAEQKELFVSSPWFTQAYARFSAWAVANGASFDPESGEIKTAYTVNFGDNTTNTAALSIALVLGVGALAAGGMVFFSRKRKKA